MTEQESNLSETLSRIKAEYQSRYGMDMDEWSAVMMADNQKAFDEIRHWLARHFEEARKLRATFKGSIKQVTFASGKQAFLYSLGRLIPPSVCALILGIFCYVYMSTYKDYQELERLVDAYANMALYEQIVVDGQLTTEKGVTYLVLSPAKAGKQRIGKTYEFDSRNKVVKVPLKRQE
jgi:hypothetical protein